LSSAENRAYDAAAEIRSSAGVAVMPDNETVSSKPVVQADEDWKQQVKAEDAALDAQFRATANSGGSTIETPTADGAEPSPADVELPPASFAMLVSMFSTQAMVALGLLADPATGSAAPQLNLARHFIDLLGVLEEKTRGNLDPREHALLETSLHQLRMLYVEQSKPEG
jgi:hypothetical protein